jgi:hypothetical protein
MKEALIIRLIKENKITEEEALILIQKDYVFVPNILPAAEPKFQPFVFQPNSPINKQTHFDQCSCNPKNGGSGICGCNMGRESSFCQS